MTISEARATRLEFGSPSSIRARDVVRDAAELREQVAAVRDYLMFPDDAIRDLRDMEPRDWWTEERLAKASREFEERFALLLEDEEAAP